MESGISLSSLQEVKFDSPEACVTWFSDLARFIIRSDEEVALTKGRDLMKKALSLSKLYLDVTFRPDCRVADKIMLCLLDAAFRKRISHPQRSLLLLKDCLEFCTRERTSLNDDCSKRMTEILFRFDWGIPNGDDIIDCFLMLPLFGDECTEEVVGRRYKTMQSEVIGTLSQLVTEIYLSVGINIPGFLGEFAHFSRLPLTGRSLHSGGQITRRTMRLCCLLFSFFSKLLLFKASYFPLQLLHEPWAKLLTSLIQSFSSEFAKNADDVRIDILQVFSWRALTMLLEVADRAPSLLFMLEGPLWKAGLESLHRWQTPTSFAGYSSARELAGAAKLEVYDCFSTFLCLRSIQVWHPAMKSLLQCCLRELSLCGNRDVAAVVNEDSLKRQQASCVRSGSECPADFLNLDEAKATEIFLACLTVVASIFKRCDSSFERDSAPVLGVPLPDVAIYRTTVSFLIELSRSLADKCVSCDKSRDWPRCLKELCRTLCSLCMHVNGNVVVPLTMITDVLNESKNFLSSDDARFLDVLIKDLQCVACLVNGPGFQSFDVKDDDVI